MKITTTMWWVAALLGTACGSNQVRGDGQLRDELREVSGTFTRVRVEESYRAEVSLGEPQVLLRLDQNLLKDTVVRFEGSTLVITSTPGTNLEPSAGAVIRIRTPHLQSVDASGATSVTAELDGSAPVLSSSGASSITARLTAQAQTLAVETSGASRIEVSGAAESQTLHASGSSQLDSTVPSRIAEVRASGAARIHLEAKESVRGEASGASEVTVAGAPPQRSVSTSGDAKVQFSP